MPQTPPNATDPLPTATTHAQQELVFIRIVLQSRGWECIDARQDGEWLQLVARKPMPRAPFTLADLERQR